MSLSQFSHSRNVLSCERCENRYHKSRYIKFEEDTTRMNNIFGYSAVLIKIEGYLKRKLYRIEYCPTFFALLTILNTNCEGYAILR